MSCWHAWSEKEGSGDEVVDVGEPVGDVFEDTYLVVGSFDSSVADPVGFVEGEDFVSPFEEGCVLPGFDERS